MATTGDDKHLDGSLSIQVRTAIRVRLLMRGEPARDLAKQLGTSEHCLSRRMASHVRLTVDGVEPNRRCPDDRPTRGESMTATTEVARVVAKIRAALVSLPPRP